MIIQAHIPVTGILKTVTGFFHYKNYTLWQF